MFWRNWEKRLTKVNLLSLLPFFTAPSVQLRSSIRQGPVIKTKKGERRNLYIPFSFVKASECSRMNESTRRDLIDIGVEVTKNLDRVNKLTVKVANQTISKFHEFLKIAYNQSDEIRKVWRQDVLIPNAHDLKRVFQGFPNIEEDVDSFDAYLDKVKDFKLVFSPVKANPSEQSKIKDEVLKEYKDKRDKRVKSR